MPFRSFYVYTNHVKQEINSIEVRFSQLGNRIENVIKMTFVVCVFNTKHNPSTLLKYTLINYKKHIVKCKTFAFYRS